MAGPWRSRFSSSAGEFAELIHAIKGGRTYANVHSNMFPGGEIRGKIKIDD